MQAKDSDQLFADINKDLGIDFSDFVSWVRGRYAKSYAPTVLSYVRRYYRYVLDKDLRSLDSLPAPTKNVLLKSLVILSKYLGKVDEFRARLKAFDIKISRPSPLNSFLRIFNASNNDIVKWYHTVRGVLRKNEALYTKFLLYTGLRKTEAIHSFNLIIELSKQNQLSDYYDREFQVLCHFKYPNLFIRRTKNCYITFLQPDFLKQITESSSVSDCAMRKRLDRKKMRLRFNELRDKFGTYLLSNGILEAEINLLQGRIPVDIFIRHYWSPKLKELGNRIFRTIEDIEKKLKN